MRNERYGQMRVSLKVLKRFLGAHPGRDHHAEEMNLESLERSGQFLTLRNLGVTALKKYQTMAML